MKFTLSFMTMALSASVLATPSGIAERDLQSIKGVLGGISGKVSTLHTAIKGFEGGNTKPVESASDTLVEAINSGAAKVKSSEELNSMDALGLEKPVSDLKDDIKSTITDLNRKKQQIVAAGKGSLTLSDLKQQKTAALKLSDAIVGKVPANLQDIAHNLASGISDAIQKGIDNFKDVGGNNKVAKVPEASAPEPDCDCTKASASAQATPTSTSLFGVAAATPSSSTSASASASAAASASASASGSVSASASSPAFTGGAPMNGMSGAATAVALIAMVMGM